MGQSGHLHLRRDQLHDVSVGAQRVLFHVPTTGLFALDEVGTAVLDLFKERDRVAREDVRQAFEGRFTPETVVQAVRDFQDLGLLAAADEAVPSGSPSLEIRDYPLSTIILNVNTGCNLSCSYCYKEDLAAPAAGRKMNFATAAKAVDLLLREGASRERVNVVFFGGEPLTNMALIRQVVDYAEQRCAEEGRQVDFSLTTNATLLTEEIIDYFDAHRFGLAVSMDGPKALHDANRRTVGGKGTYDVVADKVRLLLGRYRSRPVGARVTLTRGITCVTEIHDHLRNDLGFYEVGFAPATSADIAAFNLTPEELADVFEGMKTLGRTYVNAALDGTNIGFGNLHQLLMDLHEGTRKVLPCGAGIGLLAVDGDGALNLCHRFTGSDLPTFGTVDAGIDKARLSAMIAAAGDRSDKGCAACRIRNLCAGGCYHESYAKYGDPLHPTYHYCDLLRDWVDFGIEAYATILARNPSFFDQHVTNRVVTHVHASKDSLITGQAS